MKNLLIAGSLLALSACMETGTPVAAVTSAGPLDTPEAFNAAVVGRLLTFGESSVTINADGTMVGNFNDAPLLGTWTFEDGKWCRTLTQHSTQAATNDCQAFSLNADGSVTVTRDNGRSFDYQVS